MQQCRGEMLPVLIDQLGVQRVDRAVDGKLADRSGLLDYRAGRQIDRRELENELAMFCALGDRGVLEPAPVIDSGVVRGPRAGDCSRGVACGGQTENGQGYEPPQWHPESPYRFSLYSGNSIRFT